MELIIKAKGNKSSMRCSTRTYGCDGQGCANLEHLEQQSGKRHVRRDEMKILPKREPLGEMIDRLSDRHVSLSELQAWRNQTFKKMYRLIKVFLLGMFFFFF